VRDDAVRPRDAQALAEAEGLRQPVEGRADVLVEEVGGDPVDVAPAVRARSLDRRVALRPDGRLSAMCRSIHTLYNFEPSATDEEVRAAALQFVRKISGFSKPSRANAEAFERAVEAVAAASRQLLDDLVTSTAPKDREVEAAKARARRAQRQAA
jgi:hypothetical protein